ncbi:MAG: cysteine desulfurase NifS [Clostridiales bacterium]|nr:cysteine desulfurase NifS [Clostridiales bacterium]
MSKVIYMDNAATTATRKEVLETMLPFFGQTYGNPSSIHGVGREARKAVEAARKQVADAIGAEPREVYFTAGGSESDNWAIRLGCEAMSKKGKHIITSAIEHHAILHTCEAMEKEGYRVTYLPVDEFGRVSVQDVENAISEDTALITIMAANNEIGTLQPIKEIAEVAKKHGVLFHTDAVQAIGAIPVNVKELGVDMLSMSGHKFHGPKGIGALYVRKGIRMSNLIHGGAQERGFRAGTENLPAIVGIGKAIEIATAELPEYSRRMTALRDRLIDGLTERIPDIRLNGHRTERLPGNVNISIRYLEGESILMRLDLAGIEASSGSACTSGSLDPSHVLLAIGLPHEIAHGSLRLSLGMDNTEEEVETVLNELPKIVQNLRAMSPLTPEHLR